MRRTLAKTFGRLAAPLFVALVAASAVAVQAPAANDTVELPETQEVLGVQGQVHYLPFSGPNFLAVLRGEHGSSTNVDNPVRLITSIVSALDGNEVTIDHWEDGYDADPLGAPGASTETLTMAEGETHLLDNWVNTNNVGQMNPGGAPTPYYDGGDRLVSSGAIVVTAGGWPTTATTLHANAAVVPDVNRYGYQFTAPVGEDVISAPATAATASMWEYAGFLVIASADDTTVSVNGGGSFPLDAGQSHLVDGGVDLGDSLTADKPVLVYLVTGDKVPAATSYEGRIFRLTPTENWSNSYVTPVTSRGTSTSGSTSETTRVYLYNPGSSALTVDYTQSNGTTGSISVPADGQANYLVPQNVGARFTSSNGDPFYALHAITTPETGSGNDASASYNWGFALTPTESLTPMVVIGYGPGSDGNTENDSAVWVSALSSTRLYVDLDGDAGTGGLTDPNNNQYDFHCDVTALQVRLVADDGTGQCRNASVFGTGSPAVGRTKGTGDADMTGARLYTTSGVSIAAAWGQVSNLTAVAPAIDMGTTVLPFPTIDLSKDAEILNDDGDGEAVPGDTIRYTITMTNRGISPVDNLLVNDEVPANTSYVEDSTVANGTPITDPSTGTAFPLDEGGLLVPPVLEVGQTRTVTYDLLVDDPLPPGTTEIVNEITLESTYGTYTDSHIVPVADPGTIGDLVWNDTDGDGVKDVLEAGLADVDVELVNDTDEVIATDTTDVNGAYSFGDVYPGDYTVRVVGGSLPAGMTGTYDLDGVGTANEAAVTLTTGQTRTDVDFGFVAASISLAKTVYAGHDGGAGCDANTNDLVTGEATDDVTWCFEVTNTGPVALVGVTVDDPDLGIDQGDMSLESGNPAALASGQSVVWSYEDDDLGGNLVNDATATALLSLGGPNRTATDSAEVRVIGPGISVQKFVYAGHGGAGGCDDSVDSLTVVRGDDVTYCFAVQNTGETNLSAVTFSDPAIGVEEGDQVYALLEPGQGHTFVVETTAPDDLVNTVTATGTSPAGVQPEATDMATVDVIDPAITVEKTIYAGHDDGAGCAGGEDLVARAGDAVTWCFDVTNEGDVDLSDITIADLPLGVDESDLEVLSGSLSTLGAGSSASLYLETTADADVANTATAAGQPSVGPPVSDDDTASLDVIAPAVSVDKTVYAGHDGGAGCTGADDLTVRSGDEVTYCFEVSNEGDSPLTDVTVEDLDLDDSGLTLRSGSLTTMAPGDTAVLYLEATVDGDLDNTASVTGTPEVGEDVTDEDTASADEIHPEISVEKAVYGGHDDGSGCDSAGDRHRAEDDTDVTWCVTVRNEGDAPLTDVRIDDLRLDADERDFTVLSGSLATLAQDETVVLYLEGTMTDDLENTAVATATPPVGGDVSDADTAAVEVLYPSVEVEKTVYAGHDDGASCGGGVTELAAEVTQAVTWCFRIENTGEVDLSDLRLDDDELGVTEADVTPLGGADFSLLADGDVLWAYVEGVVDLPIVNDVTVTGTTPADVDVDDSASAEVTVLGPQIGIAKKLVSVPQSNGDGSYMLAYRLRVTNSGDTRLDDLQVVDDLGVTFADAAGFEVEGVSTTGLTLNAGYDGRTDVELLAGTDTLAIGQTEDISVTVTVFPGADLGPYLNTAVATGTSPVGVVVDDESDSGSEADPDDSNPGEPGDTDGGTDDPVPVTFPAVDLVISKGVHSTQVEGTLGVADWRIRVANLGPGDDPGPITVTDQLDERLAFVSASGDGWACDNQGQLVTCVWDQPLAAGEETDDIQILTETQIDRDEEIANAAHVASTVGEDRIDNNDSAAEVTAWIDEASVPSTLPRTGATIGGLVLLGLGLVLGGRLLQRRARGVPA